MTEQATKSIADKGFFAEPETPAHIRVYSSNVLLDDCYLAVLVDGSGKMHQIPHARITINPAHTKDAHYPTIDMTIDAEDFEFILTNTESMQNLAKEIEIVGAGPICNQEIHKAYNQDYDKSFLGQINKRIQDLEEQIAKLTQETQPASDTV